MSLGIRTYNDTIFLLESCINNNLPIILVFYINTCPYCKDMFPAWNKASEKQTQLIFSHIECSSDKSRFKKSFNIITFPHIVLYDDSGFHKLDVERTEESFVHATKHIKSRLKKY